MRLKDLADNHNFIDGIYNYCDRWCERCHFTTRCAVYAAEADDPDIGGASRDINNSAFWQKLSSIFAETREMISEWAEKNGVDISEEALAPVEVELRKQRGLSRNHPLARAAEKYGFDVQKWFENEFEQLHSNFDDTGLMDTPESSADLSDYLDIIRWYQFFIAVKLTRGLMSRIDEDEYLAQDEPRDADGSAKAALIGIDRSIGAWKIICDERLNSAETIRTFLFDLERLRSAAEREFPDARDFIRPGLDEVTPDLVQ
jgi:hypothetical protein